MDSVFVCDADRELEECTPQDIHESGSWIDEMWALLLGQAIMGLAYGPLFPIALTYIDDQVRGTTTRYYICKPSEFLILSQQTVPTTKATQYRNVQ